VSGFSSTGDPCSGHFRSDAVHEVSGLATLALAYSHSAPVCLQAVEWKSWHCLHLDVGPIINTSIVSDALIQLCLLGVIQSTCSVFKMPCSMVLVELANLSGTDLRKQLPCIELFPRTQVSFNLRSFVVSREPESPTQIVCKTLKALSAGKLDSQALNLQTCDVLDDTCCLQVLDNVIKQQGHLGSDPSYALLHALLRILAESFVSFSVSPYFDLGALKQLNIPCGVRSELVKTLIDASSRFIARHVTLARTKQRHVTPDGTKQRHEVEDKQIYSQIVGTSSINPMLLFHRFDRVTLSVVYQDSDKVKPNIRSLFHSQRARWTRIKSSR